VTVGLGSDPFGWTAPARKSVGGTSALDSERVQTVTPQVNVNFKLRLKRTPANPNLVCRLRHHPQPQRCSRRCPTHRHRSPQSLQSELGAVPITFCSSFRLVYQVPHPEHSCHPSRIVGVSGAVPSTPRTRLLRGRHSFKFFIRQSHQISAF